MYDVYTGPDPNAYRVDSATFPGGTARLYGSSFGWLMISYDMGEGVYRTGYIGGEALPEGETAEEIMFSGYMAQLNAPAMLYEDPALLSPLGIELPAGTQAAMLGLVFENPSIAYVEIAGFEGATLVRGFLDRTLLQ
jgi:hypothetical protein